MSGGIFARRGYDYQDTVTLDLLFDHFDKRGPTASARPESVDDLDLRWIEDGVERRRFVQIKKPTEDARTNLKPSPWSVKDIIRDLFQDALDHLSGNTHEQVWVLGDELSVPARSLFEAGSKAPRQVRSAYWTLVHELARVEALKALPDGSEGAKAAARWQLPRQLPRDASRIQALLAAEAKALGRRFGITGAEFARCYKAEVMRLNALLPGVLDRIEIAEANGTQADVTHRVMRKLEQRYGLQRSIVEFTLFRNLRGFISDIAAQPDRFFDLMELEVELRSIWPNMVPIKTPPLLDTDHLHRPKLTATFTNQWSGAAVEVVGISGSGKTRLAAEILERSRWIDPDRLGFYAEVRPEVSLRDCLVGAAFHLRRYRIVEPFVEASRPSQGDDDALVALATSFSEMSCKCLLLLDLVEGMEPASFTRHIAALIRSLTSGALRIVVFGQEAALRGLTDLERTQFGVRRVNMPGLSFEEFAALTERRHPDPGRQRLYSIYQQITAGREAGLNVSEAYALIRARTVDEMASIAAQPAESRLAHAEQNRFKSLTTRAAPAAEKLTCFALPFRRAEAEAVFPRDNVVQAIRELLDLGLLRRRGDETFEMHETVRAGLEGSIAYETRHEAHIALAAWCRSKGQPGAEILHLELAGQIDEARALARKAFLAGEHCMALWSYIARHRLVTGAEVLDLLASPRRAEGLTHLLRDIIADLGDPSLPGALMDFVRAQIARVYEDPQWALPIFDAIVIAEPSKLDTLIQILIGATPDPKVAANALRWLSNVALHHRIKLGPSIMFLFDRQSEAIQEVLLPLLLRGGREALKHAFEHLATHPGLTGPGSNHLMLRLHIRSSDDAADVLAALPTVEPASMTLVRGPHLGVFDELIWKARRALQPACITALRDQVLPGEMLANAIRILILLGEPTLFDLCRSLRDRNDMAGTLAVLVPAIIPALVDWTPFEARILNETAEFQERRQALMSLASSGRPLDNLLNHLQTTNPQGWPRWIPSLWLLAALRPFAAAIPIAEAVLASGNQQLGHGLVDVILRQGLAPGDAVKGLLVRALDTQQTMVRWSAALVMCRRRDPTARPSLFGRYGQEADPGVQLSLAMAIASSGATSAADLAARSDNPRADYWSAVVAHRTRDLDFADHLVSFATDPDRAWPVRRAAIAASGRLPYEAALQRIEASVMAEWPPFRLDHHPCRLGHAVMTSILQMVVPLIRSMPSCGRDEFITSFAQVFDTQLRRHLIIWGGTPAGSDAAAWLYERLADAGWPAGDAAVERLGNELRRPLLQAAVLRALQLCNRPERIESYVAAADHVWLVIRGLVEIQKLPERGPTLGQRLRDLVAGKPWETNQIVNDLIDRLTMLPSAAGASSIVTSTDVPQAAAAARLTYETAFRLLKDGSEASAPQGLLTLMPLTIEECMTLIQLANPANDPQRGVTVFNPYVAFFREGYRLGGLSTTFRGGSALPDRLRPAIAAANRFGLPMPWHKLQPGDLVSDAYIASYLDCMVAQSDESRFYTALAENAEALMPALCLKADGLPAQLTIDNRLIPALTRLLVVGNDDIFKGLCILAKRIDVPEILPVLEGLLHRWAQRFDFKSIQLQHEESYALWHGFARLTEHPRFGEIPGWPELLAKVLYTNMPWSNARSVIRVLERDPGSYSLVETCLFSEENWEHCRQDEVELLDRAAEALFNQTRVN
jgi:hypothetical protein